MAIDYAEKLNLGKAKLVGVEAEGQTNDATLTLYWDRIPKTELEAAANWEETNRNTLTSPTIEYKDFAGTWRSHTVRHYMGDAGGVIEHEFRYGYIESLDDDGSIDWSEARVGGMQVYPLENTTDVSGIADTQSDNNETHLFIKWENVARSAESSIVSFLANFNPVDNVVAEGTSYGSGWHPIAISSDESENDPSAITITLHLAAPQYTIEGFINSSTPTERTRTYLFGVPKNKAQGILNAWKAGDEGRSGTVSSYSNGLVNLVLTSKSSSSENLTISDININCDTKRTYRFAWGYTKTEIGAWVDSHKAAAAGLTRTVSIQMREDGLYDGIITEDVFGPHAVPATPDFTVDLTTGTKIVKTVNRGFNVRITEIDSIKATYEDNPAVGETRDLQLGRQDDCSFDYTGVIVVVASEISDTEAIAKSGAEGLQLDTSTGIRATAAELTSAISTHSPSAIGETFRVNISPRDDETFDYNILKVTEQIGLEDSGSVTPASGINYSAYSGKSLTPTQLSTFFGTLSGGARKSFNINIGANPDGSFNYSVVETEVEEGDDTFNVGSSYEAIQSQIGSNKDSGPSDPTPTAGETYTINANFNQDGTINYEYVKRAVSEVSASVGGGTLTESVTWEDYKGDLDGADNTSPAQGTSYQFDITAQRDGSTDYKKLTITANGQTSASCTLQKLVPKYTADGYTDTAQVFERETAIPDFANIGGAANFTYGYIQALTMNSDGTYSGVAVGREYDDTGGIVDFLGIANTSITLVDDSYHTISSKMSEDDYFSVIRIRSYYTVSDGFTDMWSAASTSIADGILGKSTINLTSILGNAAWHWRKVVLDTTAGNEANGFDAPVKVTGETMTNLMDIPS